MKNLTLEEAKVMAKKIIGSGPRYKKKHMILAAGMLAKAGMPAPEICSYVGVNATDAARAVAENA